ncbi:PA2779 family protein [Steroidobacter denitrificans]|uniref:PA2779 family protein n=1 Tax=Steroidobacter denitrificans TaxID=465721 RepID=UPI0008296E60|nr:PA2779 family protein [Steroidobacter denitrificans]
MAELLRKTVVYALIVSLLGLGSPMTVQAEILGTLAGLESTRRGADLERIGNVLAREQVREQMQALGVNQAQIETRLAGLTDAELRTLAERMDNMPAGAGLFELIGVVFVVLLILELVGVIDIFKKIP